MIQGIQIKKDPIYKELYKKIGRLVRPGWGYLNLSSSKELVNFSEDYYRYVGAVILPVNFVQDEKYVKNDKVLTGVAFSVKQDGSTLAELRQQSGDLSNKVDLVYLDFRPEGDEDALIDHAVRAAYHCQVRFI